VSTKGNTAERPPVDVKRAADLAEYMRELREDERRKFMASVRKRVEITDANAQNLNAPSLLSTNQTREQSMLYLDQTHKAIVGLGYDQQVHRLGGSNENATECKAAVARQLQIDYGHAEALSLRLIKQYVTGRGAGMLEDLDVCAPGAIEPAEFLVPPLIYRSLLTSFVGPEGSNKTIFAISALCQLAQERQHVLLLEYEIAAAPIAQIIGELGYDHHALKPYFHAERPLGPFTDETLWEVQAKHPDLSALVLDSMAEAIMSSGDGDENAAGDALKVLGPLSDYAHGKQDRPGPAVIVLGHPGHGDASRERGSSAKGPAVDVRYQVTACPPVTPERAGRLKFTCRKDRPAQVGVGTELWAAIGSGESDRKLPIDWVDAPGKEGLNAYQGAAIKAMREHAEINPSDVVGRSEKTISKDAGYGRATKHVDWLDALANDPRWSIERKIRKHAGNDAAFYRYVPGLGVEDEASGDALAI
jgi:hypothetical protein